METGLLSLLIDDPSEKELDSRGLECNWVSIGSMI